MELKLKLEVIVIVIAKLYCFTRGLLTHKYLAFMGADSDNSLWINI